jgi:hypothetical protein
MEDALVERGFHVVLVVRTAGIVGTPRAVPLVLHDVPVIASLLALPEQTLKYVIDSSHQATIERKVHGKNKNASGFFPTAPFEKEVVAEYNANNT